MKKRNCSETEKDFLSSHKCQEKCTKKLNCGHSCINACIECNYFRQNVGKKEFSRKQKADYYFEDLKAHFCDCEKFIFEG